MKRCLLIGGFLSIVGIKEEALAVRYRVGVRYLRCPLKEVLLYSFLAHTPYKALPTQFTLCRGFLSNPFTLQYPSYTHTHLQTCLFLHAHDLMYTPCLLIPFPYAHSLHYIIVVVLYLYCFVYLKGGLYQHF